MQFFRRWYSSWEYNLYSNEHSPLPQDFSNWGFVMEDGSPIPNYMPNTHPGSTTYYYFKWKYDNGDLRYHGPSIRWDAAENGSSRVLRFILSNGDSFDNELMKIDDNIYDYLIFIPLKNRGFQLYNGWQQAFSDRSQPPKIPIPGITRMNGGTNGYSTKNLTCFYNDVTNTFNYISFYYDSSFEQRNRDKMDCRNGLIKPLLFDLDTTYTDIRQNICTLIKYPYDNGFTSNLFMTSTVPNSSLISPGANVPTKIFSFGGRNFLYLTFNLVLELPSN